MFPLVQHDKIRSNAKTKHLRKEAEGVQGRSWKRKEKKKSGWQILWDSLKWWTQPVVTLPKGSKMQRLHNTSILPASRTVH